MPSFDSVIGGSTITITGSPAIGNMDIQQVLLCGTEAKILQQTKQYVIVSAGPIQEYGIGNVTVVSSAYATTSLLNGFTYVAGLLPSE